MKPQVRTVRAGVSHRHGEFPGELPLHVHVPRLQRRVLEIGIDGRRGEPGGSSASMALPIGIAPDAVSGAANGGLRPCP